MGLIAGRYLLGLKRRTHVAAVSAISFTAMALGAGALVVTLALLEGFQSTIRSQLTASSVHTRLRPRGGGPLPGGQWLADLRERHPELDVSVVTAGAVWSVSRDGAIPAVLELDEAVAAVEVNRIMAARLVLGAGSSVTVASPRMSLTPLGPMPSRRTFVVGQVTPVRPADERAVIRMSPSQGAALLGPGATQSVELRAHDPEKAWDVASSVHQEVPEGVEVVSFRELNRPLLAALQLERVMIGFGVALVIAVAALNLLCNLALLAAEKRADVAVLSALGLEPSAIRRLFVLLGLGIGALGGVLGTLFGGALATILDIARVVPLPRGVFLVSHVPFKVTGGSIVVVLGISLLAALLASLAPARAAAQRDVLEGLRYE
jgi:lipoprotein-releasing system permease protein